VCSNGTERITTPARAVASPFSRPSTGRPGTCDRTSAAAATARSSVRDPITTSRPAAQKRSASPSPWSPVPPRIAIGPSRMSRLARAPALRVYHVRMAEKGAAYTPTEIAQRGARALAIRWSDGRETVLDVRELRPRVRLRGVHRRVERSRAASIRRRCPRTCVPVRIQTVGRYAIQIEWSDGHGSGIYPFARLRELGSGS
jgi:DUF971 family protein